MKRPDSFLTNTTTETGRIYGQAKDNPGDDTGTGAAAETYNDTAYANIAVINSYKEDGISDADETTEASDMRDAIEEMVAKKVNTVSDWDSGTTYSTSNTLVMNSGFQFVNFNTTGNTAYTPLTNPGFWYKGSTPDILMAQYFDGLPLNGGLHGIHDRAGSNYNQSCLIGQYRLGGAGSDFYNFWMVHLDGTTITGDATLEAIFDPDGTDEYFNIDLIAPEVLASRTLIDCGEYIATPQSSSGNNDTAGSLLEDRFQGHKQSISFQNTGSGGTVAAFVRASSITENDTQQSEDLLTDGTNGTPRTGLTTRPKELTVGASYIIVMKKVS